MARRNARSVSEAIVKYSGSPRLLGTIDFTATSKTNAQASVAFNAADPALAGKILLVQPSQDVYVLPVATSTGTVSTSTGVLLFANERVEMTMDDVDRTDVAGERYGWLAAIRSTADGNLRVWELV
jgi:hypothetical protein